MKPHILPADLSMRERQVMEIILRLGGANARQIETELPDAPTYSAVRSILRILVAKGLLVKQRKEDRDWFTSKVPVAKAREGALQEFAKRFFADSAVEAACALLGQKGVKLSSAEADRLMKLIEEARRK